MNAPSPATAPAEVEARRRAASLAFRARLPHASPEVRAAAEMAQAAIAYADAASGAVWNGVLRDLAPVGAPEPSRA